MGRSLLQWHVKNRLAQIFGEESGQDHRAIEALEIEELRAVCTTLGTDMDDVDDPEWHDNRRGLYDYLVQEQKKEIDAELSTMPALPDPAPPTPSLR